MNNAEATEFYILEWGRQVWTTSDGGYWSSEMHTWGVFDDIEKAMQAAWESEEDEEAVLVWRINHSKAVLYSDAQGGDNYYRIQRFELNVREGDCPIVGVALPPEQFDPPLE